MREGYTKMKLNKKVANFLSFFAYLFRTGSPAHSIWDLMSENFAKLGFECDTFINFFFSTGWKIELTSNMPCLTIYFFSKLIELKVALAVVP